MPNIGTPYKSASISAASSGNNTLIAGAAGQTIRVFRVAATLAAGTVKFRDGASTDLTGAMTLTGIVLEPFDDTPLFVLTAGNDFVANLSGANQLSGVVWYTQS